MFSQQDDYLLSINSINASGEDGINISINVVPEFRFDKILPDKLTVKRIATAIVIVIMAISI